MPETDWWEKVSPYLDQALEMTDEERIAWLVSLRERDAALASHLEELLQEHHVLVGERFLEESPLPAPLPPTLAGQRLGPYTLVSLISEGGMGSVWLAQRSDGRFERRAAVKFLRASLFAHGGAERFKREGAILARLAHPHIAQLLDAGVSTTGQPYFVLEYVEGHNIVDYAKAHGLDAGGRLRLFLDALGAVEHAHSNLIVHRDIKPSNVMVSAEGEVKLLDFGIAKLLEEEGGAAAATQLTREGGGALTPQYAAPEQITGGPVTTATDVYACGVLLYELLTGQHPLGTGPHSTADLVKAIVEKDPPRLSEAAISGAGPSDGLRRQLRGDLETIVAKALKKNAGERYVSAAAFADDLRRYLRHEPISARPDSIAYRAAKFVRRNRATVALAALALAALLAGLVATTIQARRARAQRDFAFRELSRAEAVNDLNVYVLSNAAPSGKPLTVDDLLAGAEHIVERTHNQDPTTHAELLISIGQQYTVNDKYAKARRLLEEAYKISSGLPDVSTRARAACALGQVLSRQGDPTRAEILFQEGYNELPDDPMFVVERNVCLLRGAEIAFNRGDNRELMARAEAAQHVLESSKFRTDERELDTMIVLAGAYGKNGKITDANRTYRQAADRLSELGRDDTQMAGTLFNNWGVVLILAGQPREAEAALRRTLKISRVGTDNQTVPPLTLANYARTLYELGKLDEAADYAGQAYAKGKQTGDAVSTSQSLLLRALIECSKGNAAQARRSLAETEPLLRHDLPPGHIAFGILASEYALVAELEGDLTQALKLADESVEKTRALATSGRARPENESLFLARRSEIHLRLRQAVEASADAARAVDILKPSTPAGTYSSFLGHAYFALGRALDAQGKHAEAHAAFRSAGEEFDKTIGPDYPDAQAALRLAQ